MQRVMSIKGFGLIETLVALVIVTVSLLGMAALMTKTTQNTSFGNYLTEASTLAQDQLERLWSTPWANIVSGADQQRGCTQITYNRQWTVVPNADDTIKTVTVRVGWIDVTPHEISLVSIISQ
ncbi:MAG: type IV pilus modification PilV family protein [Thermodesulfobacteriota bacterium]